MEEIMPLLAGAERRRKYREFMSETRDSIPPKESYSIPQDPDVHCRISNPANLDPGDKRFCALLSRFICLLGAEGRRRLIEHIEEAPNL